MHSRSVGLVYGGGTTGLMGELARERVKLGGSNTVIGVIPTGLVESERQGRGEDKIEASMKGFYGKQKDGRAGVWDMPIDERYGQVVATRSLARRKLLMIELVEEGGKGGGFIALPGGFGSMDEVFEVLSLRQQRVHSHDLVLVNVGGFWDGVVAWMEGATQSGYLGTESRGFVKVVDNVEEAVDWLMTQEHLTTCSAFPMPQEISMPHPVVPYFIDEKGGGEIHTMREFDSLKCYARGISLPLLVRPCVHDQCNNKPALVSHNLRATSLFGRIIPVKTQNFCENKDEHHSNKNSRLQHIRSYSRVAHYSDSISCSEPSETDRETSTELHKVLEQ